MFINCWSVANNYNIKLNTIETLKDIRETCISSSLVGQMERCGSENLPE